MVLDSMHKMALAWIGLLSMTRKRTEQIIQDLVQEGKSSSEEGRELVGSLMQRTGEEMTELRKRIRTEVIGALATAGLASRDDLSAINAKLSELEERLQRLEPDH